MATIYSTKLIDRAGYGGPLVVLYFVPLTKRTVVRNVTLGIGVNLTPGELVVRAYPSGAAIASLAFPATPERVTLLYETHVVLDHPQGLSIEASGGWSGDFYVSGWELTLP